MNLEELATKLTQPNWVSDTTDSIIEIELDYNEQIGHKWAKRLASYHNIIQNQQHQNLNINLYDQEIDDSQLNILNQSLQLDLSGFKAYELNLSCNTFSDKIAARLFHLLTKYSLPKALVLDLSINHLATITAQHVAKFLMSLNITIGFFGGLIGKKGKISPQSLTINLSNNSQLAGRGIAFIADGIKNSNLPNFFAIDLSSCNLTIHDIKTLFDAITHQAHAEKQRLKISLNDNNLGTEPLLMTEITRLLRKTQHNRCLMQLIIELDYNVIDDIQFNQFLVMIEQPLITKHLEVSLMKNQIRDTGMRALISWLSSVSLRHFDVLRFKLKNCFLSPEHENRLYQTIVSNKQIFSEIDIQIDGLLSEKTHHFLDKRREHQILLASATLLQHHKFPNETAIAESVCGYLSSNSLFSNKYTTSIYDQFKSSSKI